jgi:hypothetical protein
LPSLEEHAAERIPYEQIGIRKWIKSLLDQSMLLFVVGVAVAFAISLVFYLDRRLSTVQTTPTILTFVFFKAAVEVWCSLYAGYFIFISLYFLASVGKNNSAPKAATLNSDCPSLAIVYLCCDDIDRDCLDSLCRTKTHGKLRIIVHDDSHEPAEQEKVDNVVKQLSEEYNLDMAVLRRGNREGGKPGALNYILAKIPESFEWMLVCDNDSMAMDPAWYLKVSSELQNPELACVQFRNVGNNQDSSRGLQKQLHNSIDVFEVFVSPAERYGWLPFFGHNGMKTIVLFVPGPTNGPMVVLLYLADGRCRS